MSQFFTSGGQNIGASASASSHSNEYSGLISFRIDQFDLLAVQGTLRSLFQHHSSKASVLRHSAYFMVQLSHLYVTTGKTIALTIWLQSLSAAILESKKIKSATASTFSPSVCHEVMGPDAKILVF